MRLLVRAEQACGLPRWSPPCSRLAAGSRCSACKEVETESATGYEPVEARGGQGGRRRLPARHLHQGGRARGPALETRPRVAPAGVRTVIPYAGADLRRRGQDLRLHEPEAAAVPARGGRRSTASRATGCPARAGPPAGHHGRDDRGHRGLRRRARHRRKPLRLDALDRLEEPAVPVAGAVRRPAADGLRRHPDPEREGRRVPGVRAAAGRDPDDRARQLLERRSRS